MRIGLVVDSACDLPREFIEQHNIVILPITLHLAGRDLVDTRDPEQTRAFYLDKDSNKGDAGTSAFSVEQIKELFLSKLVIDYDFVFCLTLASSRSPMHEHAVKASFAILNEYKPYRAKAGVPGPFALRVIDCQNLFAAQGVMAVEAIRMIEAGENPVKIRERLEFLAQNTHGYMLPKDLFYLRARAQKKGDRSVGLFGAMIGTALDIKPLIKGYRNETAPCAKLRHFEDGAEKFFAYVGRRVQKGLLTPTLVMSYGGELDALHALPGHADLIKLCAERQVTVLESVMSMTGGINVGDGALTLAFADEPHEVDL
jgi:DegV family protein with EDD domain